MTTRATGADDHLGSHERLWSTIMALAEGEANAAVRELAADQLTPFSPLPAPSDWRPETDPVRIAAIGKMTEELGEMVAILGRILCQGLDGVDPKTGKPNRTALAEERADVEAISRLITGELGIDGMSPRVRQKLHHKLQWLDMLREPAHPAHTAHPPCETVLTQEITSADFEPRRVVDLGNDTGRMLIPVSVEVIDDCGRTESLAMSTWHARRNMVSIRLGRPMGVGNTIRVTCINASTRPADALVFKAHAISHFVVDRPSTALPTLRGIFVNGKDVLQDVEEVRMETRAIRVVLPRRDVTVPRTEGVWRELCLALQYTSQI